MTGMDNNRSPRPYYADPTANTAIGNVMREERMERKRKEAELKKELISDLGAVLKEAKAMGCKTVNFRDIPVANLELIVAALRAYGR